MVELAATIVVTSVALAATAAAVTSSARVGRSTAESQAAVRAAATMIEIIRSTQFDQIKATFNGTSQTWASLGCDGDSSGNAVVTVVDEPTGSARWPLLKVTVTTKWRGVDGGSRRTFVNYVCDRSMASPLSGVPVIPAGTGL